MSGHLKSISTVEPQAFEDVLAIARSRVEREARERHERAKEQARVTIARERIFELFDAHVATARDEGVTLTDAEMKMLAGIVLRERAVDAQTSGVDAAAIVNGHECRAIARRRAITEPARTRRQIRG